MSWFIIFSLVWHILPVNTVCTPPIITARGLYVEPDQPEYDELSVLYIYCESTYIHDGDHSTLCFLGGWMPDPTLTACQVPSETTVKATTEKLVTTRMTTFEVSVPSETTVKATTEKLVTTSMTTFEVSDCLYPDLGTQSAYLDPYQLRGYRNLDTVYFYCNETIPYVSQVSLCYGGVWLPDIPTEICNDPCQVPVADGMTYTKLSGHTDGVILTHGSRISFTCERGDPGPTTSACSDGVWEPPILCPESSTTYSITPFVSPAQTSTNGLTGETELLTTQLQPSFTSDAPIFHSTVDHSTTTKDINTYHTSDGFTSKQITSMPSSGTNDMISNSHMTAHSTLSPTETNSASTEQAGTDDITKKSVLTSTTATTSFGNFTASFISSELIVEQRTTEPTKSLTPPTKHSTTTIANPSSAPTIGNTDDGATDQPNVTSETVAATQKTTDMLHTTTVQRHTATMPTDGSTSDISHQGTATATGEPTSNVQENTFATTGTLHISLETLSSVAISFEGITTEAINEETSSDSSHTEIYDATSQYDTSTSIDYSSETSTNLGTFASLHQSIGTTGLVNTYRPKPSLSSSDPTFETLTTIGQPRPEVSTEDATTPEIDRPTTGIAEGATTTPAEETERSTTVKRATMGQQVTTLGPEITSSWWVIFLCSAGAASLVLLLASCTGFVFATIFKERRKKDHKMFESSVYSAASGSLEFNVTYNPGATAISDPEDPAIFHY